jgi:hypothetical protein
MAIGPEYNNCPHVLRCSILGSRYRSEEVECKSFMELADVGDMPIWI